jgi:hypothetical protein
MSRRQPLTYRIALRLARDEGFKVIGHGRHGTKLERKGNRRPLILPNHRGDYDKGLSNSIRKQIGGRAMENGWNSRSSSIRGERISGQRSPSSPDASRQREL